MRRTLRLTLLGAAALGLAACGQQELILEGERLDLRAPIYGDEADLAAAAATEPVSTARAISLPPAVANPAWTHAAGDPDHNPPHAALGARPALLWSTDFGAGNSRRQRIAAQPVTDGQRIYAMDSETRVAALSLSGDLLWRRSLVPPADRAGEAIGGGLAVSGNRLYATTSFGQLTALDAATGAIAWTHDFQSPASGAPAVVGNTVYAMTRDATGWALDTANGRVRWSINGLDTVTGIVGGPSPAVSPDGNVVFAFSGGDVIAVDAATGQGRWRTFVKGGRLGVVAASIADVTGDPVIAGDRVVLGTHEGLTAALDSATGRQIWGIEGGAMRAPVIAGGSAFVVSDRNALVRMDLATGERIWSVELPLYVRDRPRRYRELFTHYGPVLAGNRLLVASDDGLVRFFDPVNGALTGTLALPAGAAADPIVAGRTLYVVTETGRLAAFR